MTNEATESAETPDSKEENDETVLEGATAARKWGLDSLRGKGGNLAEGGAKGVMIYLPKSKFIYFHLDPENKIDDEYIHRYLGPLTPTEENGLIQVRCYMIAYIAVSSASLVKYSVLSSKVLLVK